MREHSTSAIGRVCLAGVLAAGLWLWGSERPRALIEKLASGTAETDPITIAGPGRAIDGDTLVVGGVRVRLHGIDAPEADQTCGGRELSRWPCGAAALDALAGLIAGQHIGCTGSTFDSYGRLLASCRVVRNGLAWAYVRYSQRYAALEADARSRLVGVWAGRTEPPWSYRAQR